MTAAPNASRRSEKSRRATLAAALELCAEVGYAAMTVEAIAARAGVSKATIYRWWPSKGAIVLEAVDDVADETLTQPDTGDIAADLRTHLQGMIRIFTDPPVGPAFRGLLADAQQDPSLAREVRERLTVPRIATFEDRLRVARRQGQLAADAHLDVALDLLYGPLYRRLVLGLELPDAAYLDLLVEHAIRALT